jgi:hypothetical protein
MEAAGLWKAGRLPCLRHLPTALGNPGHPAALPCWDFHSFHRRGEASGKACTPREETPKRAAMGERGAVAHGVPREPMEPVCVKGEAVELEGISGGVGRVHPKLPISDILGT